MAKTTSLGTMMLLLGMTLLAGLGMLVLLSSAQPISLPAVHQQVNIPWTEVEISPSLAINGHAAKHVGQQLDAWKIHTMLLEGHCVATAVLCGPSSIEKLYLCTDPTGLVGGLFVFGNEIRTGYGARMEYWEGQLAKPKWEVCND